MTDLTAQQRAGLALWLLLQEPMKTRDIAARCGLSTAGARYLLWNLAAVVPLYYDRGLWWLNDKEKS